MITLLAKRFALLLFTLWAVATLIFFMLRVLPGDPVQFKYTSEGGTITAEQLQAQRARFGYDQPVAVQYARWITGLTRLDLGISVWSENPITEEIQEISGVEKVDVVVETGAVTVTSSTPLDESDVRAAVEEAGYALA